MRCETDLDDLQQLEFLFAIRALLRLPPFSGMPGAQSFPILLVTARVVALETELGKVDFPSAGVQVATMALGSADGTLWKYVLPAAATED